VAAGEEDIARRALARKLQDEKLVIALEEQYHAAAETSATLRRQIEGMRVKLAEAKRKLTSLIARQRAAEARSQILAVTSPAGRYSAFGKFDQLYQQVELAEAEADAFCELTDEADESLFEDDEASAVEQELAALKASIGA
jgi:phage shock protein A